MKYVSRVLLISKNGQTIRLGLKDISSLGRSTQGVRVMRLNGDDQVASVALVQKEEPQDDSKINENQGELPIK